MTIDLDKPGMVWIVSAFVFVTLAGAGILVLLAWRSSMKDPPGGMPQLGLALLSISYLWLLAVFFLPTRVAPDYSDLRYATININAGLVLLSIILGVARIRAGWRVVVVAVPMLFLWSYVAAVSAAV